MQGYPFLLFEKAFHLGDPRQLFCNSPGVVRDRQRADTIGAGFRRSVADYSRQNFVKLQFGE
jgi:hypothetical protein